MTDDTSLIEPSALRDLGSRLADILDSDHFNNVEAAFLLPALQELREARARIAELESERDAALRENAELREALIRLRDCDFVITPADRMDAVRDIARAAIDRAREKASE